MIERKPFLQRQLEKLIINKEDIERIAKINEGIYNEVGAWSALKLIFLKYWADVYVPIIRKIFKDNYFYIDLFAGSGINRVNKSKSDFIFGSPLLIAKLYKFKKMFLCEDNRENKKSLEDRLKELGLQEESFSIYKNCNDSIDDIIRETCGGHSLIFIDPYGAEITWDTMEKLLQLNADIILNFQTTQIIRIPQRGRLGSVMENFFKNKEEVKKIYGSIRYEGSLGETLRNLYMRDIIDTRAGIDSKRGVTKKTIIDYVRIKKNNRFYYDLVFIVRETKNGNPWLNAIMKAKEQIENLQERDVKLAIEVLKGRQSQLSRISAFKKFLPIK